MGNIMIQSSIKHGRLHHRIIYCLFFATTYYSSTKETTTSTTMSGKRRIPRRELPYLGTLQDRLSYNKLPTKLSVMRRLMFIIESNMITGTANLDDAIIQTRNEVKDVWSYAGYEDILKYDCSIGKMIKQLHKEYKDINKVPIDRRTTDKFKVKETAYCEGLTQLLDITNKALHNSGLITDDDRDFLLNHWDKTISSTRDTAAMKMVQNKVERKRKSDHFASKQKNNLYPTSTPSFNTSASSLSQEELNSSTEYKPQTKKKTRTGTAIHLDTNILQKTGPAADRLNMTSSQVFIIILLSTF